MKRTLEQTLKLVERWVQVSGVSLTADQRLAMAEVDMLLEQCNDACDKKAWALALACIRDAEKLNPRLPPDRQFTDGNKARKDIHKWMRDEEIER